MKYDELKRLAEAFPADLDWDGNTEPFFNGPSGESLGGGADGTYTVYGKPFRLEGEDYDYDGPTYVERCGVDFAKFMVAARDAVLGLIAENERLKREEKNDKIAYKAVIERQEELRAERDQLFGQTEQLKAENEALRKDKSEPCDGCFMAEVESLRKDSERLNWLDSRSAPVIENQSYAQPEGELTGYDWGVFGQCGSVREAIDDAMNKEAGHEKP